MRRGETPITTIVLGTAAFWLLALVGGTTGVALVVHAGPQAQISNPSAARPNSTNAQLVSRGKYIVEDVAVCTQCHTPHMGSGELDRARWLEGSALWLQPSIPDPNWPLRAPRLAGSPPGSDADLVSLLTTGQWRGGERLRPPMPQFRMSNEDAQAVVAYLRSLSPGVGREP